MTFYYFIKQHGGEDLFLQELEYKIRAWMYARVPVADLDVVGVVALGTSAESELFW